MILSDLIHATLLLSAMLLIIISLVKILEYSQVMIAKGKTKRGHVLFFISTVVTIMFVAVLFSA